MEYVFLCVIIFLFVLAVFDLSVGVSNDAVNFLNSSLGSKAASFRTVIIVASVGVFIGAAMSNGMMDIARHGIFRPEHFSFYDLICIFMAVMVTDIILLDAFNTLGMPTSTTVSMVFELLGAAFVVSLIKMSDGIGLGFSDLLNTEKALSVIIGIFLSVAIAFVFGTIVQFLARMLFSFNYKSRLKWKIGIFGGICATAIIYFLMIKGAKDLTFMTPEVKAWISEHTAAIILACFIAFTLIMQLLHILKVNVLKVIVMMGTFALAMAFAGNDLVNFIGVPLSGLASYQDFLAGGGSDVHEHMMGALNGPANTPLYFLVGAGVIMVVSLATSKKALNVSKTEIGLGSQQGGEEMFGSSRIARRLVRWSLVLFAWIRRNTPVKVRRWFSRRFDQNQGIMEAGASFDLIRASVNLVLAGALIALGTSLKLPLSTTFVTFMVAMGTSLADRAWGRESAVFRITGVISVIGGWFVTAGVAFMGAGIIVTIMHFGGHWAMFALAALTVFIIIRSQKRFSKRHSAEGGDTLFQTILTTDDRAECDRLFTMYVSVRQQEFLEFAGKMYRDIVYAFVKEDSGSLARMEMSLQRQKSNLKNIRRKETLCMKSLDRSTAIEKSAWFYLSNNCCMSLLYNMRRIAEVCAEHVSNNFNPLPTQYVRELEDICGDVNGLFADSLTAVGSEDPNSIINLRRRSDKLKTKISGCYHSLHSKLHLVNESEVSVLYVYLNLLYETREAVSSLRKYLRAYSKFSEIEYKG